MNSARRAILIILPFVFPVIFYQFYQPVNSQWIYPYFDGVAQDVGGPWRFTANSVSMIVWAALGLVGCIDWIKLCDKNQINYYVMIIGGGIIANINFQCFIHSYYLA